jgi:hypothetical protein
MLRSSSYPRRNSPNELRGLRLDASQRSTRSTLWLDNKGQNYAATQDNKTSPSPPQLHSDVANAPVAACVRGEPILGAGLPDNHALPRAADEFYSRCFKPVLSQRNTAIRNFTSNPLSNNYNSGSAPISTTTITQTGEGNTTATGPAIKTGSLTTPVLTPGQSYQGVVSMSKAYMLLSIGSTNWIDGSRQDSGRCKPERADIGRVSIIRGRVEFHDHTRRDFGCEPDCQSYLWTMTPIPNGANGDNP